MIFHVIRKYNTLNTQLSKLDVYPQSGAAYASVLLSVCYLFDGLPLEGIVFTDDAVGHTNKELAELLDVVLAVVGGIGERLCWDVSSQRQQLDEGHHVCWLQSLLLGVLQGLDRDVQQGRRLGQVA